MRVWKAREKNVPSFSCEEYIVELLKTLPVAVIGGCVGVFFNRKRIMQAKGIVKKMSLTAGEWSTGAFFAMVVSFFLPVIVQHFGIEYSIRTEIGLCGFLGGSSGRYLYRWSMHKFFGVELE